MVRRSHGDAYALLGVSHDASLAQVKAAYRRLALKLHPDVNTTGDADAFRRITEAYNYLLHTPPHHHTHSHYPHARSHRNFRHGPFSTSFTSSNPVATPGSRRLPALICGIGLALGCLLFPAEEGIQREIGSDGSAGSSDRRSSSSWWSSMGGGSRGGPRGPSRVVEPTADEEKRQRIARILLERARKRQEDGAEEEVR
ncbi:unnamed protein product [Closterium sp. NIES-53]